MTTLRAGHTVKLKRDISRIKSDYVKILREYYADSCCLGCEYCYAEFKKAGLGFASYAKEGDTGRILETFKSCTSGGPYNWHAKVIMDDGSGCKTFRLTSLEIDDE